MTKRQQEIREELVRAGGILGAECIGPNHSLLLFFAFRNRGVIIAQEWQNDGTALYADWPTGVSITDIGTFVQIPPEDFQKLIAGDSILRKREYPCLGGRDNQARIQCGEEIISFMSCEIGDGDNQSLLTDALTDLRHWAEKEGVDFLRSIQMSAINFSEERGS